MPPRAEVVLLCDQVIQDALSGKKSLIGLFTVVFSQNFPTVHPRMFIYASILAAPRQKVIAAWRLVGPRGFLQDLSVGEVTVGLEGRAELIADLVGIPFPEPGDYKFIVMLNDQEAGETSVTLTRIGTETGAPGSVH